ncbi:MAG: hypothetical protein AB7E47_06495 [Desulfovibrionaceae bacterium]
MNVIAVIPARGGSKGLPGKNIRSLCGKPLIAYTIEAALACKRIDRVIVSTDSAEIADVALRYGAEVPFLRPDELAGDRANVGEAIDHLLARLAAEGYPVGAFVTLFPTHPFRPEGMVDLLTAKLREGFSPVLTVRVLRYENNVFQVDNGSGSLRHLPPLGNTHAPSPTSFHRSYGLYTGYVIGAPNMPYLYEIDSPFHLIDIDYPDDFLLAEEVMRSGVLGERMPC